MGNKNFSCQRVDIAILCALPEELAAIEKKIAISSRQTVADYEFLLGAYQDRRCVVVNVGMGAINTAAATALLIREFNPGLVLFSGIAGALDPTLAIGDVVLTTRCFQAEASTLKQLESMWHIPESHFTTALQLLQNVSIDELAAAYAVKLGVIVTSELFPAPANFQELFKQEFAVAIDMETAPFYQICQRFGKLCLSVRSISNPVNSAEVEVLNYAAVLAAADNAADCSFRILDQLLLKSTYDFCV